MVRSERGSLAVDGRETAFAGRISNWRLHDGGFQATTGTKGQVQNCSRRGGGGVTPLNPKREDLEKRALLSGACWTGFFGWALGVLFQTADA